MIMIIRSYKIIMTMITIITMIMIIHQCSKRPNLLRSTMRSTELHEDHLKMTEFASARGELAAIPLTHLGESVCGSDA